MLPVQYGLGSDAVSGRFIEASGDTPWKIGNGQRQGGKQTPPRMYQFLTVTPVIGVACSAASRQSSRVGPRNFTYIRARTPKKNDRPEYS